MAGTTGSGKTTLAQSLLAGRDYVISIDTKHDNTWRGWKVTRDAELPFRSAQPGRYIVRPAYGDVEAIAYICDRAFSEGGWHVHFDELYQCTLKPGSPLSYPPSLVRLWTAGRSRRVTAWGCTQRPRFLPLFCMSESTHVMVFRLGITKDLKHLADMAGVEALNQPVSGHEFLYYNRLKGGRAVQRMVLEV